MNEEDAHLEAAYEERTDGPEELEELEADEPAPWVWAIRLHDEWHYVAELGEEVPEELRAEQCDGCGGPVDPETQTPTGYTRQGTAEVSYVCGTCGSVYPVRQAEAADTVGVPW